MHFRSLSAGNNNVEYRPYLSKDLDMCKYVWVRVNCIRRPREATYSGPFKVYSRHTKTFWKHQPVATRLCLSIMQSPRTCLSEPHHATGLCITANRVCSVCTTYRSGSTTISAETVSCGAVPPICSTRRARRVRLMPSNDYFYF